MLFAPNLQYSLRTLLISEDCGVSLCRLPFANFHCFFFLHCVFYRCIYQQVIKELELQGVSDTATVDPISTDTPTKNGDKQKGVRYSGYGLSHTIINLHVSQSLRSQDASWICGDQTGYVRCLARGSLYYPGLLKCSHVYKCACVILYKWIPLKRHASSRSNYTCTFAHLHE